MCRFFGMAIAVVGVYLFSVGVSRHAVPTGGWNELPPPTIAPSLASDAIALTPKHMCCLLGGGAFVILGLAVAFRPAGQRI